MLSSLRRKLAVWLVPLLLVGHASFAVAQDGSSPEPIRIGILTKEGATRTLENWSATAGLLNSAARSGDLPYRFSIVPLTHGTLYDAATNRRADLLFTDAASFVALEVDYDSRPILSAAQMWNGLSFDASGALLFTLADSPVRKLEQLKGLSVMAVAPNDFDGWWLAEQTMRRSALEPDDLFGQVVFSGGNQREVVYAVRSGLVDVGVVRAGVLENLAKGGSIELSDYAPIANRSVSGFPFWVSTALYPDWVLSSLPEVPEPALTLVINTLLSIAPDSPVSTNAGGIVWQAPQNYRNVHDLLISLRVRPYENYILQASKRIIRFYRWPIVAVLATILLSLAFLSYQTKRNIALAEARRAVLKSEMRSRKFYRSAIEEHTVFCMLSIDGSISHVNDRFAQISGQARKVVIGQPLNAFLTDRDQEKMATDMMPSMDLGVPWNSPLRIRRRDGSGSAWVQCSFIPVQGAEGNLAEIAIVASDMTEAQQNTREEQFGDTLELIQDQVVVLRPRTLEIMQCNRAAEILFLGRNGKDRWKGKTASDFITKEDEEILRQHCDSVVAGPQRRVSWEASAKNGTEFEITLEYIQPDSSEPRLVAIYRDVTERLAADKAKREFISTVSHELRTPLTSMKGALGLVLSGSIGELPDKANKMVSIASSNCDRLVTLINDILDLEKIEAGKMDFKMEELDLEPLVHSAIEANQFYADKFGVKLARRVKPAEGGYRTYGDRNRMMQVMDNLVSNAVKYSEKGSIVDISLNLHKGAIRLSVRDYGAGIPAAAQPKIFEKFVQADSSDTRAKGGTGLGLSIVRLIMIEHKGRISFESEEGKGTEFFADLPRVVGNVVTPVTNETLESQTNALQTEEEPETTGDKRDYLPMLMRQMQDHSKNVVAAAGRVSAKQLSTGQGIPIQDKAARHIGQETRSIVAALLRNNMLDDRPIAILEGAIDESKTPMGSERPTPIEMAVADWVEENSRFLASESEGREAVNSLQVFEIVDDLQPNARAIWKGAKVIENGPEAVAAAQKQGAELIVRSEESQSGRIVTILPTAGGRLSAGLPVTLVVEHASGAAPSEAKGVVSKFKAPASTAGRGKLRRKSN